MYVHTLAPLLNVPCVPRFESSEIKCHVCDLQSNIFFGILLSVSQDETYYIRST